jgi:hypothetical protein
VTEFLFAVLIGAIAGLAGGRLADSIEVHRRVAFGQWRGCWLFVHVGPTCVTFGRECRYGYAPGLELFTAARWFALRPFRRLTWRRA